MTTCPNCGSEARVNGWGWQCGSEGALGSRACDIIAELRRKIDLLERFETYTNHRLDELGVPEPDSCFPATAPVCRVGNRFDWVAKALQLANDLADDLPANDDVAATQVSVYLDTGVVYAYDVADAIKGREHAAAIIKGGYRHTAEGSNDLEWFPPHRIDKVKVAGGGETSAYRDRARAT